MTNDYKDKLLKYLTGNITNEPNSNTPFYEAKSYYENNDLVGVTEIIDTLYCKNAKGELTGNMLIYGNTTEDHTTWNGVIILVDRDFKVLKKFTEYNTGTKFSVFERLNIDEKGQVFGIDYSSNKHRLILLNNISEKGNLPDYQCILRQSYFLQGNIQNVYIDIGWGSIDSRLACVEKSKQSALYFISGMDNDDYLYGASFRINVGDVNEWTEYSRADLYQGIFLSSYVYFDEDDNISCNLYFSRIDINNKHFISKIYNQGTDLNNNITLIDELENYVSNIWNVRAIPVKENKVYIGVGGNNPNGADYDITLKVLLYDNGTISFPYERVEIYTSDYPADCRFTMLNNEVFMVAFLANDYVNDEKVGSVYVNLLSNDNVNYEQEVSTTYKAYYTALTDGNMFFGVSNQFNLYNILVSYYGVIPDDVSDMITYSTKIVYRNGYNGEEKESENSLLPTQVLLFHNLNELIFARNLYNNKVYNNRSISVLNVPNTFLNGIEIGIEKLVSDTNTILVSDTESITKNVYEDLYINFNNQITMQNRNETNYVDNLEGAIRLNQSSCRVLDYSDSKASKVRVNYDDNTNYVTMASNSINNGVCTYQIVVYVPSSKNIQSIEIISNDENTVYQRITNLNLTKGKYYVITQDVYIE